jgi:hypothetical protein
MDKRGEKLKQHTSNCPEGFSGTFNEIETSTKMCALQTSSCAEQIAKNLVTDLLSA